MSESARFNRVPTEDNLRKWNIWLAVIYAMQALAVLVVGSTQLAPLTTSFLTVDSLLTTTTGSLILAPATHHLFDLNLLYVAFAVLALLAAIHASQATWYRQRYEAAVGQNHNDARWLAYGLTACLTFIVLAVLAGVTDISLLLAIFVLGIILHGSCAWVERAAGQRGKTMTSAWFSFGVMILAGVGMWAVIVLYLWGSNVYGGGHIPARVYWLAVSAGLTALCFSVGLWRQARTPKLGHAYRLSDQRYMALMLASSSLLVWQIVAGTMH